MSSAESIDHYLSGRMDAKHRDRPENSFSSCVRSLLKNAGIELGESEFSRFCALNSVDPSFSSFKEVAHQLGVLVQLIDIRSVEALPNLYLPCIAELDDEYFVVRALTREKAVIFSPQRGELTLSLQEFELKSSGPLLCLSRLSEFDGQVGEDQITLSGLYGNMRGLKKAIGVIFLFSVVVQIFAIVVPLFAQLAIDKIIPNQDANLLIITCLGFGLVMSLDAVIKAVKGYYATNLLAYLNANTLSNVYEHLVHLPLSFFERYPLGDILSRFKSIEPLNGQVTNTFVSIIMDTLMVISMVAIMMIYAADIAMVSVVFAAVIVLTRYLFNGTLKILHREACEFYADSSSYFIETFSSMQSVRVYRGEKARHRGWLEKHLKAIGRDQTRIKMSISADVIADLLSGFEMIIVIALIAMSVIESELTIGAMFAYLSYRTLFSVHASSLIKNLFELRQLSVFLKRISSIVTEKRLSDEHGGPAFGVECSDMDIEVENLSYTPSGEAKPLFSNLSFVIRAGELAVITGASGSGKTTLMRLMLGLIPPSAGAVLVAGQKVDVHRRHHSLNVAAVLQGDRLYSGSILENVVANAAETDIDWVIECCKLAGIHDEVVRLERSYQTVLSRGDPNISMGQEQRLLFARALYQRPAILFLDEATSHLDPHNEALLNERIRSLGITRVVIAHRGDIALHADRVIDISELKSRGQGQSR